MNRWAANNPELYEEMTAAGSTDPQGDVMREQADQIRDERKYEGEIDRGSDECPRCHGDGEIPVNPGHPDPQTETSAKCPDCHGSGKYGYEEVSNEPCRVCGEMVTAGGKPCRRCQASMDDERAQHRPGRD